MEGIETLKADTTLDKFNPIRQLSKNLPPYLQSMNEVDKEINLKFIESMNKKITFLKNPRTLPAHLTTKTEKLAEKSPFRLVPETVTFTEYEEGGVYEIPITITNVAGILRRIQAIPPATEYFSIGQITYPDKEKGEIAPGMSATILVRFHAVSLAEYDDEFLIKTEQDPIVVPLRARREPPNLTLVEVMDCGTIWIGDRVDISFRCQNVGGSAGFKFFHENEELDAAPGDEILMSGPFTIFPLQFYLATGQFIDVLVSFQPKDEGVLENKIILACDNQTSQFYTLKGFGAALDISVSKIDDKPLNFKENPLNSIWFNETHPNSDASRDIYVSNLSALPVAYHWSTYVFNDTNITLEAHNNHYSITPIQGILDPGSTNQFKITFRPASFQPFNEYADLFVDNIPLPALKYISPSLKESPLLSEIAGQFLGSNAKFPSIPYLQFELHGKGSLCELEFDPVYYVFPHNLLLGQSYRAEIKLKNKSQGSVNFKLINLPERTSESVTTAVNISEGQIDGNSEISLDFTWITNTLGSQVGVYQCSVSNGFPIYFQIQSNTIGPEISLESSNCDFGIIKCKEKSISNFTIKNESGIPAHVTIGHENFHKYTNSSEQSIIISPNYKEIAPYDTLKVSIEILSNKVDTIEEIIKIAVKNGEARYINIFAEVQKPVVSLDCYEFKLGQLAAGIESKPKTVTLINYGNLDTTFKWVIPLTEAHDFKISPSSGEIKASSKVTCEFTMIPFNGGNLDEIWVCEVEGLDSPLGILTTGDVKGLEISYIPADDNNLNTLASLTSSKQKSILPPSLYNASDRQSYLSSMTLSAAQPDQHLKVIDFGYSNIGDSKSIKFIIKNSSGLRTTFDLKMDNYEPGLSQEEVLAQIKAKEAKALQFESPKDASPRKIKFTSSTKFQTKNTTKRPDSREKLPPLLSDAHEQLNKFSTKEGETFTATKQLEKSKKFYLSNNKGLAFVCEPKSGVIDAHSEVIVTVTMYNDICGRFEDILVSSVKGLKPHRIPIRSRIKGSPLVLAPNQLGVNYKVDPPILSLGTLLSSGQPLSKKIKLYNSGPKDIWLDWKIFNYKDLAAREDGIFKISLVPTTIQYSADDEKIDLFDVKFQVTEPAEKPSPFSISPKEAIISGRKETIFTISFTSEIEEMHEAVILAHPKIVEEEDTVLGELGINLQAKTILPWLHVDKVQRADGFYYLAFDGYSAGGPNGIKDIGLSNITSAILSFTILIENGPFMIVQAKSSAPIYLQDYEGGAVADKVEQLKLKKTSSNLPITEQKYTLAPEDNLQVFIKFLKPNLNDIDAWPLASRSSIGGSFLIRFSNGHEQRLKLEARLYRPKIIINSEQSDEFKKLIEQDFGIVNIQFSKKLSLFLSNVSPVDAKWRLNYVQYPKKKNTGWKTMTKQEKEDDTILDDPEVFQFSISEGVLKGPSVPLKYTPTGPALPQALNQDLEKLPLQIQILFKPKLDKLYKSMFKIITEGGPDLDFVLKGRGSYLEEYDR
ncbi:unnamed protein product [Blepharisma stoltei]|uniref:MSP domain-containing protein n=1 Tax=Blepharisma stoltei TaxID=1481888 RepID=A0AAU9IKJ5_9CILI|nr:unnamed protein product [Blepharisma stoltei]